MKTFLLALVVLFAAETPGPRVLFSMEDVEAAYPRVSRDGKEILYQTNVYGKWQLAILDVETNTHTRVTEDTANNNFPDWSADNRTIAFVSDRHGNEEIYLMDRDSAKLKRITKTAARDIHPYFSPDGKFILFNSTRGNGSLDIFRYETATGKTVQLTNTPEHETCARYSPDMQQIVFLRNSDSSDDVFVMNANDLSITNITNTPKVRDGWPMYSPDGKWIYYSSMESGVFDICRIRPDGSGKEQVTRAGKGEEDARVYVSPDNRTIIYNKRVGRTIRMMSCAVDA